MDVFADLEGDNEALSNAFSQQEFVRADKVGSGFTAEKTYPEGRIERP